MSMLTLYFLPVFKQVFIPIPAKPCPYVPLAFWQMKQKIHLKKSISQNSPFNAQFKWQLLLKASLIISSTVNLFFENFTYTNMYLIMFSSNCTLQIILGSSNTTHSLLHVYSTIPKQVVHSIEALAAYQCPHPQRNGIPTPSLNSHKLPTAPLLRPTIIPARISTA